MARLQPLPVRAGRGYTSNGAHNAASSPPEPPSRLPGCRNPRTQNACLTPVPHLPSLNPMWLPRSVPKRPVNHSLWQPQNPPRPHPDPHRSLNSHPLESIVPVRPGCRHLLQRARLHAPGTFHIILHEDAIYRVPTVVRLACLRTGIPFFRVYIIPLACIVSMLLRNRATL